MTVDPHILGLPCCLIFHWISQTTTRKMVLTHVDPMPSRSSTQGDMGLAGWGGVGWGGVEWDGMCRCVCLRACVGGMCVGWEST